MGEFMEESDSVTTKILSVLEKKSELSVFQLIMTTGMATTDVYNALRNLAREEKIKYVQKGNSLRIGLNDSTVQ